MLVVYTSQHVGRVVVAFECKLIHKWILKYKNIIFKQELGIAGKKAKKQEDISGVVM